MSIGLPDDVSDRASITIPNGRVGSKSCNGQVEVDRIVHVLMNVSVKPLPRKRWRALEGGGARPGTEPVGLGRELIRPFLRRPWKRCPAEEIYLKLFFVGDKRRA